MAQVTMDDTNSADQAPPGGPPSPVPGPNPPPPKRRRRVLWRVLIGLGVVLVLLVGAGAAWWFFGRDEASQRSTDDVLKEFRQSGAVDSDSAGRPAVGVYSGVADGSEDIGIPGLTESFGPGAPVTVTHGDGGCFTYRADLNTHHWRTWTFCPAGDAAFALTEAGTSTVRDVPGLSLDSLTTYTCTTPVPYLWPDPAAGARREGTCTGTSDTIKGVTTDAGAVEVLDTTTVTVGGVDLPVVHVRSTDTFGDSQTGTEVDEWWLDARTGLPVKLVIDADLKSSVGDYVEKGTLELSTLTPTT
jgi:hypothetical protein